jgi:hypothetical protein
VKHSIIPAEAAVPTSEPLPILPGLARALLLHQLHKLRYGRLRLIDGTIDETFGAVQMLLTKPRSRRASIAVVNAAPA